MSLIQPVQSLLGAQPRRHVPAQVPAWRRADREALAESPGEHRTGGGSVINGFARPEFTAVAQQFAAMFGRPDGGGGALAIRWHGEPVVDVWKGYADAGGTRPWTRDTLSISFSTTKGLTSTVIHRLADRGLIGYDEPVAAYWPQFAARGKADITVRELLSHQAGLHNVRAVAGRARDLLDHVALEDRLAAAPADRVPGRSAYHALTYGWLLAGLARRVTGCGMAELVRTEVAEPLGVTGLHIGAPHTPGAPISTLMGSALQLLGPQGALLTLGGRIYRPSRRASEALVVRGGFGRLFTGSAPLVLSTEMPAANGLFTAEALATLYAALAGDGSVDGRRLLSAETVEALGRVQVCSRDLALGLPMRWRLGYHQAFTMGELHARHGFGHFGFGGSGGWADPATGLSVGYVSNNVGALTTPMGSLVLLRLNALALETVARLEAAR